MIPIQPVEGSSLTGPVASITSGNPNSVAGDFAAIIDWGDGASSGGGISSKASGGFFVNGVHRYAEEGAYDVAVRVTDTNGSSTLGSASVAVRDADLHAQGQVVPATRVHRFLWCGRDVRGRRSERLHR
jgi:hypothetical protein